MNINDKVIFRTCGRGKVRTQKGTIYAIVEAGKLPPKDVRARLPHGSKPSNRPRYIVYITKNDTLVWANATGPNIVLDGQRLPKHKPRLAKPSKVKNPAKVKTVKVVKVKAKKLPSRAAQRKKMTPAQKALEGSDPVVKPVAKKRSGGDKPKTTWYGIVDGKVVSVRKVVCPEGFKAAKAALVLPPGPVLTETAPILPTAPALPVAAEAAALPQA